MTQPNIIVIMTDDESYDVPVYGGLDTWFCRKGVQFLQGVCTSPQCSPSRWSFFTGQYAHNHGLYSNDAPAPNDYHTLFPATEPKLLPVALKAAGYKTALFGKYVNGYWNDANHIPQGWDYWYGDTGEAMFSFGVNENGTIVTEGTGGTSADYHTNWIAAKAAAWIAARVAANDGPFFCFIGFNAPHEDMVADPADAGHLVNLPIKHDDGYNFNLPGKPAYVSGLPAMLTGSANPVAPWVQSNFTRYQESLLSIDRGINTIMGQMGSAPWLGIYTSDHGVMQGQHRIPSAKCVPYSIRVPFFVAGNGINVAAGVTRDDLVANIDLTATILDYAGATPLIAGNGLSVRPLLESAEPAIDWREFLLVEFMGPAKTYAWRTDPTITWTVPPWSGVRSEEWYYIKNGTGELELYDLEADPGLLRSLQTNPIYSSELASLERVRAKLAVS